jgi:hypothetical protein
MSANWCIWEDCLGDAVYCEAHAQEYAQPQIDALRAEVERLRACRAELREATEALADPAVNNLYSLPEAIRRKCAEVERLRRLIRAWADFQDADSLLDQQSDVQLRIAANAAHCALIDAARREGQ